MCLAGGCIPNPCLNGGTCTEDGTRLACLCLPGYGGSSCERRESPRSHHGWVPSGSRHSLGHRTDGPADINVGKSGFWFFLLAGELESITLTLSSLPRAPRHDSALEKCSSGWDGFQGACYKHFSTRRSWEDAESQCRHYGGHLATILTPEEQDFINGTWCHPRPRCVPPSPLPMGPSASLSTTDRRSGLMEGGWRDGWTGR